MKDWRTAQILRKKQSRAHIAVSFAVTAGELVRQPCERCGATESADGGPINGHHEDYDKPLEVIWLCRRCHARRHMELRREAKKQEQSERPSDPLFGRLTLQPDDAWEVLGISREVDLKLLRDGQLRASKIGNITLIHVDSIRALRESVELAPEATER
jgi:hypothetical protein